MCLNDAPRSEYQLGAVVGAPSASGRMTVPAVTRGIALEVSAQVPHLGPESAASESNARRQRDAPVSRRTIP